MRKLELKLDQNPCQIFYKDEGGKSNYMTASCIVSAEDHEESFPIGNLKLEPHLIYEDGGEIEDEGEIFNVISVEPKTITSANEVFTVHFRVEKVSRRKDGKRFRIRFDANREKSQLLDYVSLDEFDPVETCAVTVLSKRKSHGQLSLGPILAQAHSRSLSYQEQMDSISEDKKVRRKLENLALEKDKGGRKRRISAHDNVSKSEFSNSDDVLVPYDFLVEMKSSLSRLEDSVKVLTDRVSTLEQNQNQFAQTMKKSSPLRANLSQSNLSVFSRGQRVHSLIFDEFSGKFDEFGQPIVAPPTLPTGGSSNCLSQMQGTIKRNGSSTQELFEFLTTSSILN